MIMAKADKCLWRTCCFNPPVACGHLDRFTILRLPLLLLFSLLICCALQASAQERSLAELMPRIPPKTIEEAKKSFKLEHGFSLELVASEPHVTDPIDAAFDEKGRMYVVEMNDYPFLPEQRVQKYVDQRPQTWGRIRLLSDTDGDGRMDQSVVFADKLRWPQSVCCSRGGVFVLSPPHLHFLKDTDGDGVADQDEIVCSGFNSSNVQGLSNGLEWGRDNAIYFASGMAGGELTIPARGDRPAAQITPGRRDLRLDPETFQLTMVSGGQQFGHTIDNWGERFICSNSSHIVHVTWPLRELERNPLLAIPDLTRAIAKEGAAAVVFRASSAEPWRLVRTARRAADPEMKKRLPPTELVPIGFFTSATGITVYRGGVYPPEFQGNVFIGDCGGNLVHRKTLSVNGISFVAERADQNVEFLTSTDNWFRPVNFVNAPDGTLYVLDMYRETIEHPASIPDDIKALVDLESGYDKGRIWRLVPPNYRRVTPQNLDRATTPELVNSLNSPHGWIRDTAQRLLVERKDPSAASLIRQSFLTTEKSGSTTSSPQARIHSVWTLVGLNALTADDVERLLRDPHERLRELAIRTSAQFIPTAPDFGHRIVELADDPSLRVRWQLALTLGDLPAEVMIPGLKRLASAAANDSDLRVAWLSSAHAQMGNIAVELLSGDTRPVRSLIVDIARLVGSAPDAANGHRVLTAVMRDSVDAATRIEVLLALGEGLRRRGASINSLLADSNGKAIGAEPLARVFQQARNVALKADATEAERLSSIALLAYAETTLAEQSLPELLTPQTAPQLQLAAVKSLATHGTPVALTAMIDAWKGLGPATRREIVDQLVQSVRGATTLLQALEAGSIKTGEVERDKRQLLINHPQVSVRDIARRVLAEAPSSRKQVLTDYQPTLDLTGDAARGQMLLTKTCLQCHRAGTNGHQVGPDFTSVQNKASADLLIAILDPNREAQPSFQTYTAVTKQGRIFTGITSTETAASVTLKRAEAKEDVILRDTLEEFVSNGVSLMPEGLEKDLNQQQLADIIAALKAGF